MWILFLYFRQIKSRSARSSEGSARKFRSFWSRSPIFSNLVPNRIELPFRSVTIFSELHGICFVKPIHWCLVLNHLYLYHPPNLRTRWQFSWQLNVAVDIPTIITYRYYCFTWTLMEETSFSRFIISWFKSNECLIV